MEGNWSSRACGIAGAGGTGSEERFRAEERRNQRKIAETPGRKEGFLVRRGFRFTSNATCRKKSPGEVEGKRWAIDIEVSDQKREEINAKSQRRQDARRDFVCGGDFAMHQTQGFVS